MLFKGRYTVNRIILQELVDWLAGSLFLVHHQGIKVKL